MLTSERDGVMIGIRYSIENEQVNLSIVYDV